MSHNDWKKTRWQDEKGNVTTIHEVLTKLKDEPIISLSVKDLAHLPKVPIEQHRKEKADLSCPIIIVEKNKEFQYILDGHHRLQRSIDENSVYILAKIMRSPLWQ
jgi:hypothetical protein